MEIGSRIRVSNRYDVNYGIDGVVVEMDGAFLRVYLDNYKLEWYIFTNLRLIDSDGNVL